MRILFSFLLCVAFLSPAHADEEHGARATASSGISYKEGHGLYVSPELKEDLGLALEFVEVRSLKREAEIEVEFITDTPSSSTLTFTFFAPALNGTAWDKGDLVTLLNGDGREVGKGALLQIAGDKSGYSGASSMSVELPGELPTTSLIKSARLRAAKASSLQSISKAAVLKTVEGTFVYVRNGDAFLRTPITLGAEANEFVEVTDGLFEGDEVLTKPIELLWVSELQAIRGGVGCADGH